MAHELTEADRSIRKCLDEHLSFAVIAGAGSGKTTSLISALDYVRSEFGRRLRRDGQRVACITYTKRAREVVRRRLNDDDLFEVSTIHSFLWQEVARYTEDMRDAIATEIIPARIEKQRRDAGGNSQKAQRARQRIAEFEEALNLLGNVQVFEYKDGNFSDFAQGVIGHDDVIDIAASMIQSRPILRRFIGQKYPFTVVDEAQDTFPVVVEALNLICGDEGLPIVGYFGDPMQQIYEERAGQFAGPPGYALIQKEENYRSAKSVIELANKLRSDLQQEAVGPNAEFDGEVSLMLVEADPPEGPHRKYTDEQLDRALSRFDGVLESIGWRDHSDSKRLYLARQMIARRLGFLALHRLFDGEFASQRANEEFEDGTHFLVKPIVETLWPLAEAARSGDELRVLDVLRRGSPAFDLRGRNAERTLKYMLQKAKKTARRFSEIWETKTVREVLTFARMEGLCVLSERLAQHLDREPRQEEFNKDEHGAERSDWLADAFFESRMAELSAYCHFVTDSAPFSTQHGVKGEEYEDVLVLFDDVEAAWNNYSFTKLFIPGVAGEGTRGQIERSTRLAYVCFTRARKKLQIILFCPSPEMAKAELVQREWFAERQVLVFSR